MVRVDTTVVWVDDKSFFVIINEPSLSDTVLKEAVMASMKEENWTVETYEDYMLSLSVAPTKEEEEKEDETPPALLPSLHKRLSSVSSWMKDMFSSSSSAVTGEGGDEGSTLTGGAKKRARVEK